MHLGLQDDGSARVIRRCLQNGAVHRGECDAALIAEIPEEEVGFPPGIPAALSVHLRPEVVPDTGRGVAWEDQEDFRPLEGTKLDPGLFRHSWLHAASLRPPGLPTITSRWSPCSDPSASRGVRTSR